ncbi:MAG: hypothetical protein WC869_10515 [Phycisphaerae bacterium]|jgi:hypothetical protein
MGHGGYAILAAILAAAFLGFEHYFPWQRLLSGRDLPRLAAYTLGVLALAIPYTIWGLCFDYADAVIACWVIIVVGGFSVLACYVLDSLLDGQLAKASRDRLRERLNDSVRGGPNDRETGAGTDCFEQLPPGNE